MGLHALAALILHLCGSAAAQSDIGRDLTLALARCCLVEAASSTRWAGPRPFSCQRALLRARPDRRLIRRTLKSQVAVRAGLGPWLVALVDCLPAFSS